MDQRFKDLIKINKKSYAQMPSRTDRRNNEIDEECQLNQYSHSFFIDRSEFSRDKDRILFSRAFRRMEHKAQIFSHERGDHYRTRLTHTLEVLQIARNICRYLGLNEDLVEAITLGHDIGHTPFGHEGERVLDEILCGKARYNEIHYPINYTGFKHNYNSLKVLDIIEKKYNGIIGLNLNWQVLEGILKHTKIKRNSELWCDIDRFLFEDGRNRQFNAKIKDMLKFDHSVTLEGQIVAIADEIAQRQHDLDDGMRDEKSSLKYEEVFREIKNYIKLILKENRNNADEDFLKLMEDLDSRLEERKGDTMIRHIIEYFICDVTLSSFKKIESDGESSVISGEDRIFCKKLIDFSIIGKELDKSLLKYINNRVVNSNGVNRFDGKANYVIKRLFKAYYSNPRQMSAYSLQQLSSLISINSRIFPIKLNNFKDDFGNNLEIKNIKFSESHPDEVKKLIDYLKIDIDLNELNTPFDLLVEYLCEDSNLKLEKLQKLNSRDLFYVMEQGDDKTKFLKCMLEDHYAFLSTICDYIAGMTDNFANSEYSQLYQT